MISEVAVVFISHILSEHIHSGTCSWYTISTSTSGSRLAICTAMSRPYKQTHLSNGTITHNYTFDGLHLEVEKSLRIVNVARAAKPKQKT